MVKTKSSPWRVMQKPATSSAKCSSQQTLRTRRDAEGIALEPAALAAFPPTTLPESTAVPTKAEFTRYRLPTDLARSRRAIPHLTREESRISWSAPGTRDNEPATAVPRRDRHGKIRRFRGPVDTPLGGTKGLSDAFLGPAGPTPREGAILPAEATCGESGAIAASGPIEDLQEVLRESGPVYVECGDEIHRFVNPRHLVPRERSGRVAMGGPPQVPGGDIADRRDESDW